MTVLQEQIMPSSLIYSILETSSQSRMAPSPESALVAWKPRSAWQSQNVNMVGWLIKKLTLYSYHAVLLRWKQPFGHYRVGRLLSLPMARIPKSQAMSSRTLWKGRKLAPSSLKWNLQVQSRGKNIFPTCCICVFMFDACILTPPGPTVEQQTEMARHAGRTLASLHPEQVSFLFVSMFLTLHWGPTGQPSSCRNGWV